MSDRFAEQLEALRAARLHRKLREIGGAQGSEVELVGKRLVNFSSNDYLGLAGDERLRAAAIGAVEKFGVGAGASRLISGTQSPHVALETALARWKGTEAAVVFSSGYAAAVGTLPALVSKKDVVILDKLCHASLIDGAKLSGATLRVFPHNHLGKLESLLQWAQRERPGANVVIVTESVFSMDGDRALLREILDLKTRFGAMLFLDEAHAVGVLGPMGRGLAAELGCETEVDVQMGTLSKALGVSGGYICGSRSLIEWIINRARSFVYSTAPPPALAAAGMAAVEIVSSEDGEIKRDLLWTRICELRTKLNLKSADRGSAIIPWMIGGEEQALRFSSALQNDGFFVPAIRYPTVAKGAARLRITVSAAHTPEQIDRLGDTILRLANLQGNRSRLPGIAYGLAAAEPRRSGDGT
jgi:8-amino-7-oxononanoate synthase